MAFVEDPLMGDSATDKITTLKRRLRRSAARAKAPPRKKNKSEVEKLKRPAGWLNFNKKLQRRLDGGDY